MKKTLMALFALALCASVASAGVGINWGTGGAFMTIPKRTWSAVARLCSTSTAQSGSSFMPARMASPTPPTTTSRRPEW
jgi:hypothetical protein